MECRLRFAPSTLRDHVNPQAFRSLLAELIARDRERGDLPARIDAEATASLIATYSEGLNRVAVVAYDRSCLERQTELLLDSLGL